MIFENCVQVIKRWLGKESIWGEEKITGFCSTSLQFPANQFSQHSIPRIRAQYGLLGVLSSSWLSSDFQQSQKTLQQAGRAVPSPGSHSPGFPCHKGMQSCSVAFPLPWALCTACKQPGWPLRWCVNFSRPACSFIPLASAVTALSQTKCPWLICPAFVCLGWYECSFYGSKHFVHCRISTTNTGTVQGNTALL